MLLCDGCEDFRIQKDNLPIGLSDSSVAISQLNTEQEKAIQMQMHCLVDHVEWIVDTAVNKNQKQMGKYNSCDISHWNP